MIVAAAALLVAAAAPAPRVGEAWEITLDRESRDRTGDGSGDSSSHDRDVLIERVVGVRADGLELAYDLPADATAEDRASNWQFPARVFRPLRGSTELLNADEMRARVDRWLKEAELPRSACGHWIFTWNAFRIECEPLSVLRAVAPYDLRDTAREGAPYVVPGTRAPAPLVRKRTGADGSVFEADLTLDPEAVRRARADDELALAEMTGKSTTPDAAQRAHADEAIAGTVVVTIAADAAGEVQGRTTVTPVEVRMPDGKTSTQVTTERVERRPLRPAPA